MAKVTRSNGWVVRVRTRAPGDGLDAKRNRRLVLTIGQIAGRRIRDTSVSFGKTVKLDAFIPYTDGRTAQGIVRRMQRMGLGAVKFRAGHPPR